MAAKWGECLRKGLGFCWRPRRWLPFFVANLACGLLILLYIHYNAEASISMLSALSSGNTAYLALFVGFLVPIFLIGIACALINLWISGAVIYQSYREGEFRKSWGISWKRYPPLLAAVIATGILTYLAGLPFAPSGIYAGNLGLLLPFVVSAILYFPMQIVIVRGRGAWDSLAGSWQLFRDQAREKLINRRNLLLLVLISEVVSSPALLLPGHLAIHSGVLYWIFCWFLAFAFFSLVAFSRVVDAMALVAAVSLAIFIVFSIPFLLVLWNISLIIQATYSLGSGAAMLLGLKSIIREGLLPLASSGIILLIGLSISRAFSLKAQTEFYLRFRKRILGIF